MERPLVYLDQVELFPLFKSMNGKTFSSIVANLNKSMALERSKKNTCISFVQSPGCCPLKYIKGPVVIFLFWIVNFGAFPIDRIDHFNGKLLVFIDGETFD